MYTKNNVMKTIKRLSIICSLFIIGQIVHAQSTMNIKLTNGSTSNIDYATIKSIVFENNSFVIKKAECEESFYSIFLSEKVYFGEQVVNSEEIEFSSNSIRLYPNPVTSLLTVERTSDNTTTVYIFTMLGNMVKSFQSSEQNITFDIGALPTGVYFLSVDNQLIKFVKQ